MVNLRIFFGESNDRMALKVLRDVFPVVIKLSDGIENEQARKIIQAAVFKMNADLDQCIADVERALGADDGTLDDVKGQGER